VLGPSFGSIVSASRLPRVRPRDSLIDVSCSIPAPGRNMPRREQKGVSRHTNEKREQKRLARHARARDPKLKRQLDSLLSGCIFRFVRKRISSCGCFVARFDLVHMDPTRLHTLSIMFSQSVPHLAEREPRTRQSSIRRGKKVDWWNRTPDRGRTRGFALLSKDLFLVKAYHPIFEAGYTEKGPQPTSGLWYHYKGCSPVPLS
jgi:hypothetical protein